MLVSAYNSNSVKARNILAMSDPNDIFSVHCFCTAHVNIDSAKFAEKYMGPGRFHKPYMKLTGTVTDIFLENQGENFPCGTNSIQLMDQQDVIINYSLSYEEIALLASRGLYCKGYLPPDNIVGNTMEIPVSVVYTGIYDTPCCFISITDPYEMPTSTQLNGYVGLFQVAEVHPEVIAQLEGEPIVGLPIPKGYESQYNIEVESESEFYNDHSVPDNTYEDTYEDEPVEETVQLTPEEQEENDIIERVNAKIGDKASNDEFTHANSKADDRSISDLISAVHSQVAADQARDDDTQNLYDRDDKGNKPAAKPGSISTLSDRMAYLKRKAQEDANGQLEQVHNNDVAADNMALNEGITDIAGYGAGDDKLSSTEKQKAKSERDVKKQQEIARRNDIAEDNKALNEGITDIAGQGAAESKPSNSAQSLLAGLGVGTTKPAAPQDDRSSQFL